MGLLSRWFLAYLWPEKFRIWQHWVLKFYLNMTFCIFFLTLCRYIACSLLNSEACPILHVLLSYTCGDSYVLYTASLLSLTINKLFQFFGKLRWVIVIEISFYRYIFTYDTVQTRIQFFDTHAWQLSLDKTSFQSVNFSLADTKYIIIFSL